MWEWHFQTLVSRESFDRAQEGLEIAFSRNLISNLEYLNRQGELLVRLGKYDQADPNYVKLLEISEPVHNAVLTGQVTYDEYVAQFIR